MASLINTLIVEDHDAMAFGIRETLRTAVPMINLVATAKNPDEAWKSIKNNKIHFVIMDICLKSELNGISLTSELTKEYPELAILIYSGEANEELVRRARDAGARGYVPKGGIKNLISGIKSIITGGYYLEGGFYLDPSLPKPKQYIEHLTPKEEEVLKLIAEGKTKEEICQVLNFLPSVLKTHADHIRSKRNLKNWTELYQYGIRCYPN